MCSVTLDRTSAVPGCTLHSHIRRFASTTKGLQPICAFSRVRLRAQIISPPCFVHPSEFLLLNISTAIRHGSALAGSALANPSGGVSGASFLLKQVQVRVVGSITPSPLTPKSPPTGNFRGADVRAEAQADAAYAAGARPSYALGSLFKPGKRAADVSLFILGGFRVRRYRLGDSEHDIHRGASLGVNLRLALAALQNGSPGSRPPRVLTSRRCRHNLSFPAVSTCPLFTLHHFYSLPVFSSPLPTPLLLRLPLLCVHAARPDSFDLRAVHVVEI